ncbi:Spy/CpxP family protein refolding chaperone [Flavobacterium sp.]|uniref:Spy/CpxP family protein refolding chaperone n=1 Tax=Flavobacterium sp. TaxID=239 RepID=UPI003D2B08F7
MKKLFLAALLSLSMITVAQEEGHGGDQLTVEQRTELKIKKMTLDLDLNSKQQQELKTLFLEEGKKMESKKEEMKAKREKKEKLTAEERFELKNKMLDKQIEMKAKMKKILTPEQMSKFEKMKDNKPNRMQKKERMHHPKK